MTLTPCPYSLSLSGTRTPYAYGLLTFKTAAALTKPALENLARVEPSFTATKWVSMLSPLRLRYAFARPSEWVLSTAVTSKGPAVRPLHGAYATRNQERRSGPLSEARTPYSGCQ